MFTQWDAYWRRYRPQPSHARNFANVNRQTPKQGSQCLCRFFKSTQAVSSLEYAILIGVVTVAIGGAIVTFGDNLKTTLETMAAEIPGITIDTSGGANIQATP